MSGNSERDLSIPITRLNIQYVAQEIVNFMYVITQLTLPLKQFLKRGNFIKPRYTYVQSIRINHNQLLESLLEFFHNDNSKKHNIAYLKASKPTNTRPLEFWL